MAPRILLVEDDPVTRAYLIAALEALPASVDAVDTVAGARAIAMRDAHALWLIDANLPDGDGASLLAELRASGRNATPAIAHTATQELATLHALVAAGFVEALTKPLTAATLHDAVRRALRSAGDHGDAPRDVRSTAAAAAALPASGMAIADARDATATLPTWDDAVALKALGGERSHVDALRALFTGELPATRQAVVDAAHRGDVAALDATLHRLRASCGFVGATRLGDAAAALQRSPGSAPALTAFASACAAALPGDDAPPT